MINLSDNLSGALKLLRIKYQLSMTRAAITSQISPALWQQLEIKKIKNPTLKTLLKIASTFGVSIDDLIGRKISKPEVERQETLPSYFINHDFNAFK